MRRSLVLTLSVVGFALASVWSAAELRAAPLYSVLNLGSLPSDLDYSEGRDVNESGQVAGRTLGAGARATLIDTVGGVTIFDLHNLDGFPSATANAINDFGQVVGTNSNGDRVRPFLFTPSSPNGSTGTLVEINNLPNERNSGRAIDINASGQIVGGSGNRAFLWTPTTPNGTSGNGVDLGDLDGGFDSSVAFGINDVGQVVGFSADANDNRAFIWTPNSPNGSAGAMVALATFNGQTGATRGLALNNAGVVVGDSVVGGGQHAVLWTTGAAGSSIFDLGEFDGGSETGSALGINSQGEVVGFSNTADSDHAFLWTAATQMVDLNTLLNSSGAGWTLRLAQAINDQGQIVGYGTFDADPNDNIAPVTHGFLLTPVPEPSTYVLLAIGVFVIAARRYSQRKSLRLGCVPYRGA